MEYNPYISKRNIISPHLIYHGNPAQSMYLHVWSPKDQKCSFKMSLDKKWRMWKSTHIGPTMEETTAGRVLASRRPSALVDQGLAMTMVTSPVTPVNSPHKGQWRGALIFSLICPRTNSWANDGGAGDLRRHRAHYDVIVMTMNPIPAFWAEVSNACHAKNWFFFIV